VNRNIQQVYQELAQGGTPQNHGILSELLLGGDMSFEVIKANTLELFAGSMDTVRPHSAPPLSMKLILTLWPCPSKYGHLQVPSLVCRTLLSTKLSHELQIHGNLGGEGKGEHFWKEERKRGTFLEGRKEKGNLSGGRWSLQHSWQNHVQGTRQVQQALLTSTLAPRGMLCNLGGQAQGPLEVAQGSLLC
jgi:hypothetical protein